MKQVTFHISEAEKHKSARIRKAARKKRYGRKQPEELLSWIMVKLS